LFLVCASGTEGLLLFCRSKSVELFQSPYIISSMDDSIDAASYNWARAHRNLAATGFDGKARDVPGTGNTSAAVVVDPDDESTFTLSLGTLHDPVKYEPVKHLVSSHV
jgi:hypothetical protein